MLEGATPRHEVMSICSWLDGGVGGDCAVQGAVVSGFASAKFCRRKLPRDALGARPLCLRGERGSIPLRGAAGRVDIVPGPSS
jgi:hypothetical protein